MKKWLLLFLPLLLIGGNVFAQGCALCSLNAKNLGQNAGLGLNHGILYLAAIPILFIIVVGIIWFRRTRPDLE